MIDSVNYIVHNVRLIDLKYLRSIGIVDIKPYNYELPGGRACRCYRWSYKSIEFKFNTFWHTIQILANTHKILTPKIDITLSDKEVFENKVYEIVCDVLNENKIKMELDRVDYYADVKLDNFNQILLYLRMYEFQMPNLGHTQIKGIYVTSIHRTSKRGQYNINIYSKYDECKDERYKNVLRIELQMKRAKMKKEFNDGIRRELLNYWSSTSMEQYFFDFYRELFGYGKPMKFEKAKDIINASSYSEVWKKKLIKFLKKRMKSFDWKEVVKTRRTYESYRDKLKALNINALCIPKQLEILIEDVDEVDNLLDKAYEVAVNRYFV